MRTRSQARRRRQPQVRQTSVESSNLEKPDNPPIVTMDDNRTMAQLPRSTHRGYEDGDSNTTRSGDTYPKDPKAVSHDTRCDKVTLMPPAINGSTEDVQTTCCQKFSLRNPNPEPRVAPVKMKSNSFEVDPTYHDPEGDHPATRINLEQ
ncbi:hypothetical protein Tco_1561043 [Tanacetum coccineum]